MTDVKHLDRLSGLLGLQVHYHDAWGRPYQASEAAQRAMLAAMGFPADTDEAAEKSIRAVEQHLFGTLLPPVVVATDDETTLDVPLSVPLGRTGSVAWLITLETGERMRGLVELESLRSIDVAAVGPTTYERRLLTIPHPLPHGYHRLTIHVKGGGHALRGNASVIGAPKRCYRPPALEGTGRRWGMAVQLYNVRSERNWGIGDFTDLVALLRGVARLGASCIGLNPLHALFPSHPDHASPYSPSSRLFLNVLYLDVEAIADYEDSEPARRLVRSRTFQERLKALRESTLVDYRGVTECKLSALDILYRSFRERWMHDPDNARAQEFRRFQADGGRALRRFAVFQALAEHAAAEGWGFGWRNWPIAFRDPDSPAVAAFAKEHEERVEFHEYLQWQADLQIRGANLIARRLGLGIGLYHDLAVGANDGGAESWDWNRCLAQGASAGAPPDAWNLKGQDWGLPPFLPLALRESRLEPFTELLRANMRRGGALRIDHIMGLMRLYWVPVGFLPTEGAYVFYPWRELLAVLALESHRCRCLVIGEDLGTVPPRLRESMADSGILSYRLFYFERESDQRLRDPSDYPVDALVAIGTHDLPTFPGYWGSSDIAIRDQLDLWPTPQHRDEEIRERERDRAMMTERLVGPQPEPPPKAPVAEAYAFLARTPSRLLMVQPEDVLGQSEQINVPGTVDQYPNWRHRLQIRIEELPENPVFRAIADSLNEGRDDRSFPKKKLDEEPDTRPAIPLATYRLQLNADFTFDDAARVAPYIRALGASHLYASPWLKARRGSAHGYDITDHNAFNPELGGAQGFEHLAAIVDDCRLGHVLDFVPNHMGIGKADNAWWLDVLEWGEASPYADYFDIDWNANPRLQGKILLPFLGDQYGRELEAGKLIPRFDPATGSYSVWYFEHRFPLTPFHYGGLIRRSIAKIATSADSNDRRRHDFLSSVAAEFEHVRAFDERSDGAQQHAKARQLKGRLAEFTVDDPAAADLLAEGVATLCGTAGEPATFEPLHQLLEQQHYRLAYWGVSSDEINYRRFFNINDLAGIRIENSFLFEATHRLVERLVQKGKLHGLRIDHIDGLFDPAGYCANLRSLVDAAGAPESFYVVVEKILARHERLRDEWPIQGTTGYDFLAQVNGIFVAARNEPAMTRVYERFVGREMEFDELLHEAKLFVMESTLGGELAVLARDLDELSERHWSTRDYTLEGLRGALKEIVACFPVYRSYVTGRGADPADRRDIAWAASQARKRWRGPGKEMLDFIEATLTGDLAAIFPSEQNRAEFVRFAMRVQQFSGPVMAKGLEDTAFYRHHRLRSLNEVGGDPRTFGLSLSAFHHLNQERVSRWPHGMLATATHDTKVGEDVRARINVLSELPAEWGQRASRWASLNRRKKQDVDGRPAPGRNDEYLFYQMLVGAWPLDLDPDTSPAAARLDFVERMQAYMRKAVREAKLQSSWANPNIEYEAALERFVARVLDPRLGRPFLRDFLPYQARIAGFGMLNGLAQLALKLTCPGVPDIYQGCELWDLHLVDPDNRRTVDFAPRQKILKEMAATDATPIDERIAMVRNLRENWRDGRIKLYVLQRLLRLRRLHPLLFTQGSYQPLETEGPRDDHIFVFQRSDRTHSLIVATGRLLAAATPRHQTFASADHVGDCWSGTSIRGLTGGESSLEDALTGRRIDRMHATLPLSELFATLPIAVLVSVPHGL